MNNKYDKSYALVAMFFLVYISFLVFLIDCAMSFSSSKLGINNEFLNMFFQLLVVASIGFCLVIFEAIPIIVTLLLILVVSLGAFVLTGNYIAVILSPAPMLVICIFSIKKRCNLLDGLELATKSIARKMC